MGYRIAVLHQGFIPIYRLRLFELLNTTTGNEYVVFHGNPPKKAGHLALAGPFPFPNVWVRNREFSVGSSGIVYQPVSNAILRGGFDALVVGHEIKFVASMALFFAFKGLGRPAVLWGHGLHRANATWPARASSRLLARAADAYLVYTPSGRAQLEAAGVDPRRIFVARNTLDIALQQRARQRAETVPDEAIRQALGLRRDARVLLCIGRLIPRKAVDTLIGATRRLNADPAVPPFEVLIAGDGPERTALEALARGLANVHFLGSRYEPDDVARLMKIAAAVVLPGTVGLAVNHAFAFGRPVVTRAGLPHPPEIEYVETGRNGLVTAPALENFVGALAALLRDETLRARLAAGADDSGRALTLDHTVQQFDAGVRHAIAARRTAQPEPVRGAPAATGQPDRRTNSRST
jgi:glycosyltransferase involved in cell wall biosynthesis